MKRNQGGLRLLAPAGGPRPGVSCAVRPKAGRAGVRTDVTREALAELRSNVMARRIQESAEWLNQNDALVRQLDPEHACSAPLIAWVAQCLEGSSREAATIRELLGRVPRSMRGRLTLQAYVHLRLAEGILALAERRADEAAAHFDFVITADPELAGPEFVALAHYWKALSERELGRDEAAMTHATQAHAMAQDLGSEAAAAMMLALEGCILAGKGKLARALDLLREAEAALEGTSDFTWLGNIQFAYGHIALEEGRCESAMEHLLEAAGNYRRCDPVHRSLGETLIHLARSRRFIASRAAQVIDGHAARRRRLGQVDGGGCAEVSARREVDELRGQAEANLIEAMEVCAVIGDVRVSAFAQVERGILLADCGQFDCAWMDAEQAFDAGWRAKDYAVLGSARLLQSRIALTQYEEGIGNAPLAQAQRSSDYAKEAVNYARQSVDRRLLASALTWQGLVHCSEVCSDAEAAETCCREAGELLAPGNRSRIWEEHRALVRKIARGGKIDARLREWSQGFAGGKTFQQMSEEFADLVIPSVWEKEGRNVSRVVAKLSISPKKVRRILSRAGLKA